MSEKYKKIIIIILNSFIVIFVGRFIYVNLKGFTLPKNTISIPFIIISAFCAVIAFFVFLDTFIKINRTQGVDVSKNLLQKLYINSVFSTYIPGKVFVILKRKLSVKEISLLQVSSVYVVEVFFTFISSGVFAIISLILSGYVKVFNFYLLIIIIFLIFLFLIQNKVINTINNIYSKIIKKKIVLFRSLKYTNVIKIIIMNNIGWFFLGLSYALLTYSMFDYSISTLIFIAGVNALAGIIGMLAFFSPSGIGVREGVIVVLLTQVIPSSEASFLAIMYRLWFVLIFQLLSVIVLKILLNYHNKQNH